MAAPFAWVLISASLAVNGAADNAISPPLPSHRACMYLAAQVLSLDALLASKAPVPVLGASHEDRPLLQCVQVPTVAGR